MCLKLNFTKFYSKKSWGACWYALHKMSLYVKIYFLQLPLLNEVEALSYYIWFFKNFFHIYLFIFVALYQKVSHDLIESSWENLYIYIFVTFIHSVHNFPWFPLISVTLKFCIKIELLQTNINDNISQSFQEKSIQQNI